MNGTRTGHGSPPATWNASTTQTGTLRDSAAARRTCEVFGVADAGIPARLGKVWAEDYDVVEVRADRSAVVPRDQHLLVGEQGILREGERPQWPHGRVPTPAIRVERHGVLARRVLASPADVADGVLRTRIVRGFGYLPRNTLPLGARDPDICFHLLGWGRHLRIR